MSEQPSGPELSVVLPALNEEAGLDDLLTRLGRVLGDQSHEILDIAASQRRDDLVADQRLRGLGQVFDNFHRDQRD